MAPSAGSAGLRGYVERCRGASPAPAPAPSLPAPAPGAAHRPLDHVGARLEGVDQLGGQRLGREVHAVGELPWEGRGAVWEGMGCLTGSGAHEKGARKGLSPGGLKVAAPRCRRMHTCALSKTTAWAGRARARVASSSHVLNTNVSTPSWAFIRLRDARGRGGGFEPALNVTRGPRLDNPQRRLAQGQGPRRTTALLKQKTHLPVFLGGIRPSPSSARCRTRTLKCVVTGCTPRSPCCVALRVGARGGAGRFGRARSCGAGQGRGRGGAWAGRGGLVQGGAPRRQAARDAPQGRGGLPFGAPPHLSASPLSPNIMTKVAPGAAATLNRPVSTTRRPVVVFWGAERRGLQRRGRGAGG